MRDIDEGDAQAAVQALDLQLQILTQLLVERAERLVHQQHGWIEDDRTRDRDALLLAAGELLGKARLVAGELDEIEHTPDMLVDLWLWHAALPEREADVLRHRQMRKQGVVLEHHADVAPIGRGVRHHRAADQDVARRRLLEAGDHHERRGLAGAGRAQEGDELAGLDIEAQIVDRAILVEGLDDMAERYRRAGLSRRSGLNLIRRHDRHPRCEPTLVGVRVSWVGVRVFAFAGICARVYEYEAASRLSSQPLDDAPKDF